MPPSSSKKPRANVLVARAIDRQEAIGERQQDDREREADALALRALAQREQHLRRGGKHVGHERRQRRHQRDPVNMLTRDSV